MKQLGTDGKRVAGGVGIALGLLLAISGPARAADPNGAPPAGATPAAPVEAPFIDRREIVVPARGAELVRIDNLLGRVAIRGTARPGEIHVVAEKRAASPETLGRLRVHYTAFESGEIQIDTRVELGGRERSLPLAGSGIDLWLEVPPDVAIEAKTFGGDVSASGLRAGAKLETTGGRIGVSDVRGGVVTHQLRGGQKVAAVEGDVDLDGVEGDMDLKNLGGGRVDARLVDGSIHAEDIRDDFVRLVTTTGRIVLIGMIRPAAHYDLRSYAGRRPVSADRRAEPLRAAGPLGHAAGQRAPTSWFPPRRRVAARRVSRPPSPAPRPHRAGGAVLDAGRSGHPDPAPRCR